MKSAGHHVVRPGTDSHEGTPVGSKQRGRRSGNLVAQGYKQKSSSSYPSAVEVKLGSPPFSLFPSLALARLRLQRLGIPPRPSPLYRKSLPKHDIRHFRSLTRLSAQASRRERAQYLDTASFNLKSKPSRRGLALFIDERCECKNMPRILVRFPA